MALEGLFRTLGPRTPVWLENLSLAAATFGHVPHEAGEAREGEWDQEPVNTDEWAIVVAKATMKCSKSVLSCFVEWCESPCEAVSRSATSDASETLPLVRAVMPAPGNSVQYRLHIELD